MKKMYKTLGSFMTVYVLLMGAEANAGCRCDAQDGPLGALQRYDAVFSGTVKNLLPINSYDYIAEFEVDHSWKGGEEAVMQVKSTTFRTSCGYKFKKRKEYLVYAYQHEGTLFASQCSRTAPLNTAENDMRILGLPRDLASVEQ